MQLAQGVGPIHEVWLLVVSAQNVFKVYDLLLNFIFLLYIAFVIEFGSIGNAFALPLDIIGSQSWRNGGNLFLCVRLNFLVVATALFDLPGVFDHLLAKHFYFGKDFLISMHLVLLLHIIKRHIWMVRSSIFVIDASSAIALWIWSLLADFYTIHVPCSQFFIHNG